MGLLNPYTTLLSASSVVTGSAIDFGQAYTNISMLVRPSGTITGGTVTLELSHDGVNFIQYANTGSVDGTPISVASSGEAWRFARGSITDAITGGGTVTCTIMAAGA